MRLPVLTASFAVCLVCANLAVAQNSVQQQSVDLSGMATVTRPVDKTYPVTGPARVYIANHAGTVRIVPWNERVVRVQAQIQVGAPTAAQAERFAQSVDVDGNHVGDRIEIRTRYPEADPKNEVGYGTNLEVSVPEDASVEIHNAFGDIYVRGINGDVSITARFCAIDLRNLRGTVRVQAKGPLPLVAENLSGGGTFVLRSTDAKFNDVEGSMIVDNYLGGVSVTPGARPLNLDVTCESGPIHLYLGSGALPQLIATADSGNVRSDVVLASETWGGTTTLRNQNPDAEQKIDLFSSFSDVYIHQQALAPAAEPLLAPLGAPITDTLERDYDLLPGTALRLSLMPGEVTIEGHDGPRVQVSATRFVRVTNVAAARLALEGLAMRADFGADYLGITTAVQDDMEALGCTEFRMDVKIRLPRGAPVLLRAKEGPTSIANTVADISLEQELGSVTLNNVQGAMKITLRSGAIDTTNTSGSLDLTANDGDVTVRQSFGPVRVQCEGGNTLVDTPSSAVTAHSKNGDVRLIAVDGVKADYDIETENGNISLAVPEDADAVILLNVFGGSFYSSVPLTGESVKDTHNYQGRLNAASHRILLKASQGNIVID